MPVMLHCSAMKTALCAVIASASLIACSLPPERQIVSDAVNAIGGETRLMAVKTFVLEGEGTNGNLGQDMTMDATGQRFIVAAERRALQKTQ